MLLALLAPLGGCDRGEEREPSAAEAEADDSVALPPGARPLPGGVTAEMAAQGRRLYAETCVVCHGTDAAGTQLGPSLVDAEWTHVSDDVQEIARITVEGVPEPEDFPVPMPPLGGGAYTDEEVRAIAAYVYSLGQD